MSTVAKDAREESNVFYPKTNKMRYLYIFLALVGLFTVLWFFLFKEEAIGVKLVKEGINKLSETKKSIVDALSSTSPGMI